MPAPKQMCNVILTVWSAQPPITFQPPPPPGQTTSTVTVTPGRQVEKPAQPDLITRYNLKDKVDVADVQSEEAEKKGKGWSSNREERQTALQKRRDEMILQARRKMMARMAADKEASEQ